MSDAATRLLEQALGLSDHERGELAARLIDSLDPTIEDDDDVETERDAEIRKRVEDLQQGRVQTVAWAEARRIIAAATRTEGA